MEKVTFRAQALHHYEVLEPSAPPPYGDQIIINLANITTFLYFNP